MVYPKGESVKPGRQNSLGNSAYCVRSACELGMDIIKTTYTGGPGKHGKVVATVPSTSVSLSRAAMPARHWMTICR